MLPSSRYTLLALCLLIVSGIFWLPQSQLVSVALFFTLAGIGVLGVALWHSETVLPRRFTSVNLPDTPLRWRWIGFGVGLLGLLAEINGGLIQRLLGSETRWTVHAHLQMALLIGGVALIVAGIVPRVPRLRLQRETGAVLGILALALLVRVWNLENEVHTLIDEYHIVKSINDLHAHPTVPILTAFDQIAAFPWVWTYVETIFTDVFGANLAALRLQSALWGTLTVLGTYYLTRAMAGRRTALLAMLLLATFPPHIHLSRLAMLLIVSPALGVWALWAAVRAVQTQQRGYYALCGILLGLTSYYDEAGRLVFPLLILLWWGWLRLLEQPSASRRGLAWTIGAAVVVAFPLYYTLWGYGTPIFPRMEQNNVGGDSYWIPLLFSGDGMANLLRLLQERILPPFLHYIHLPDTSQLYYAGNTPLVLPILVPFFLLGVGVACWRNQAVGMLLLLWLIGVALGNNLVLYHTWTARYMPVAPALMIVVAVGVMVIWDEIGKYLSVRMQSSSPSLAPADEGEKLRALVPLPASGAPSDSATGGVGGGVKPLFPTQNQRLYAILLILLAVLHIGYYFGVHLPEYRATTPPFPDYSDVVYRMADLPRGTRGYFVFINFAFVLHFDPLLTFWGKEVQWGWNEGRFITPEFLATLPLDRDYAMFVDPRDTQTLERLRAWWGTLPRPQWSPYNIPRQRQYALYWLRLSEYRGLPQ